MLILDHLWWLMIPGILLGLYAQFRVRSAYSRYLQVPAERGLSGAQAAREILDQAGLHDMPVNEVPGQLSDHYDPLKKALFLSSDNFHGRSLAALGVAAHEAGHALQHAAGYLPMQVRQTLVPVTQFASNAAVWIGLAGYMMGLAKLAGFAIIVFGIITLFQLVTLPVEFDASRRAKDQLLRLGLIGHREREGVSRVLNAAALTYVAAMISSLLTLLHFILIFRGSDRD
ncbi:MAG: zinc metallopeptidase [Verrucomicrobia bacterium]|nr:zinc metallopeptidase [Verrucomicrobiota bacterium]